MRIRVFTAIFLGLLAGPAALAAGPALAQPRAYETREGVQPLDRLLPGIRRQHPGTFYDAQPSRGPNGDPQYRLKWMTPDGRVIWYDADARSGRVVGQSTGRERFDGPRQPYMADPYDRGYGRMRERERQERGFAPPARYDNPSYESGGGRGEGRGRRWRRD